MVRRRSTVRFRNGAPLKYQVRSSLDTSHPTLWMGAVAVFGRDLGDRVLRPAELVRSPARVSREMPGSTVGPGGLRHRRTGTRFRPESRPAAMRTRDDHPTGAHRRAVAAETRAMYSITADRADHHGLAVRVWGRLAAGLDRADLLEPREANRGVRKPVLRGSLSVPSTRPSCSRCIASTAAA
jgi:hypothetical protein